MDLAMSDFILVLVLRLENKHNSGIARQRYK